MLIFRNILQNCMDRKTAMRMTGLTETTRQRPAIQYFFLVARLSANTGRGGATLRLM